MALDHTTFLTQNVGGSVTVTPATPSFNIVTSGSNGYAGGNVYAGEPVLGLLANKHEITFKRNVVAAGWHDDDFTDGTSTLTLIYNQHPDNASFSSSNWAYSAPDIPASGMVIRINFREIPSRAPRIQTRNNTVTMTTVQAFSNADFDGTNETKVEIDASVADQIDVVITAESGARYTATIAETENVAGTDAYFVWHLHDYAAGNEETISDFNASGMYAIELEGRAVLDNPSLNQNHLLGAVELTGSGVLSNPSIGTGIGAILLTGGIDSRAELDTVSIVQHPLGRWNWNSDISFISTDLTYLSPFIRVESRLEGNIKPRCIVTLENANLWVSQTLFIGVTDYSGEFYFRNLDPLIEYRVVLRGVHRLHNSVIYDYVVPQVPI